MSETAKTCVFLAAAVVAVGAAKLFEFSDEVIDYDQLVGQELNTEIDVTDPRRLQIVKFDRPTATVRRFEVAEVDGVWSIPSKQNYPADATRQMAAAVDSIVDLKILRVAGNAAQAHEEFGVVDPLASGLDSNSQGVGARVIMTDSGDEELVDMIIGKPVKDEPGQRYVRRSNQDAVYVVELDPSTLSTDFADWIEHDLLQFASSDLRETFVNDYSADFEIGLTPDGRIVPQRLIEPRSEMTLARDDEFADWELKQLKLLDPDSRTMVDATLGEDEKLDQSAVDDLVTGLADLLIVDIARKPEGLSADLKAGEAFLTNQDAVNDLVSKGFIPGNDASGSDILSSEGELICTMRDGVEYVLRFGKLQVQTEDDAADETDEGAASAEGAEEGEDLRRYLFVMARFNQDAIPEPEIQDLPELPPEEGTADSGEDSDVAAEDGADEADQDAEAAGDDETDETGETETDDDAEDGQDGEAEGTTEEAADADVESADAEDAAETETPDREAILAEREAIEAQNEAARSEYDDLVAAGQEKVEELNRRFGDWYFVISNDVYKQIHVGRDDLIEVEEEETESDAGDAGDAAAGDALGEGFDLSGAIDPSAMLEGDSDSAAGASGDADSAD